MHKKLDNQREKIITLEKCIEEAGFQPQLRNQLYKKRRKPKNMEIQEINY